MRYFKLMWHYRKRERTIKVNWLQTTGRQWRPLHSKLFFASPGTQLPAPPLCRELIWKYKLCVRKTIQHVGILINWNVKGSTCLIIVWAVHWSWLLSASLAVSLLRLKTCWWHVEGRVKLQDAVKKIPLNFSISWIQFVSYTLSYCSLYEITASV